MTKKSSTPPERSLIALRALERATRVAKRLAYETNTYFITEKDGKVIKEKITAQDL
jgi:hypothetical protein